MKQAIPLVGVAAVVLAGLIAPTASAASLANSPDTSMTTSVTRSVVPPGTLGEPTCLISTSLNKPMVCAELRSLAGAQVGSGRFTTRGDPAVTLTVTVEYQSSDGAGGGYQVLSSSTVHGTGNQSTMTGPALPSNPGLMRACAQAVEQGSARPMEVCTSGR